MNQEFLRYGLISAVCFVVAFGVWKYRQPNFSGGDKVPEIEVVLIDGQQAKLSDLAGKYVLLQFWGSWCGPCRRENPHLIQLYNKYHDKGFEIFSIGIEPSRNSWLGAIKNDGMIWRYHTMESMDFDGPLAKKFNIKSIPATFLLNPDGVIMGVNLAPEYLEKMLSEKL